MLILGFHLTDTKKKIGSPHEILDVPQYHILFKSIQHLVDRRNVKTWKKLLAQIS